MQALANPTRFLAIQSTVQPCQADGLAAGALAGLTATVWLRHRRTARQLSELEAGGAPRRRRATNPRP